MYLYNLISHAGLFYLNKSHVPATTQPEKNNCYRRNVCQLFFITATWENLQKPLGTRAIFDQ